MRLMGLGGGGAWLFKPTTTSSQPTPSPRRREGGCPASDIAGSPKIYTESSRGGHFLLHHQPGMFIPYQNTHNAANLLYMFIGPSNMPKNTANFFFWVDIFLFHSRFWTFQVCFWDRNLEQMCQFSFQWNLTKDKIFWDLFSIVELLSNIQSIERLINNVKLGEAAESTW